MSPELGGRFFTTRAKWEAWPLGIRASNWYSSTHHPPKEYKRTREQTFYNMIKTKLAAAAAAAAVAKSLQSCPTLRDPRDGSPPGSSVPGILQARTLEWVAISFSNAGKWKVKVKSLSRAQLSDPMDWSLVVLLICEYRSVQIPKIYYSIPVSQKK